MKAQSKFAHETELARLKSAARELVIKAYTE